MQIRRRIHSLIDRVSREEGAPTLKREAVHRKEMMYNYVSPPTSPPLLIDLDLDPITNKAIVQYGHAV